MGKRAETFTVRYDGENESNTFTGSYKNITSAKVYEDGKEISVKKDEEKGRYVPICVKTERVDGEKIKDDTYYTLKNGEFSEVEE